MKKISPPSLSIQRLVVQNTRFPECKQSYTSEGLENDGSGNKEDLYFHPSKQEKSSDLHHLMVSFETKIDINVNQTSNNNFSLW